MTEIPGGLIWGTRSQLEDLDEAQEHVDLIFLLRDPRDVVTSMWLYDTSAGQPGFEAEANAIQDNLGWYAWYLRTRRGLRCQMVRYEELWVEPEATIAQLLARLGRRMPEVEVLAAAVQAESFPSRTGRARGEEDVSHHLRKGIIGDWYNYWSLEQARRFQFRFRKQMEELGYVESQ